MPKQDVMRVKPPKGHHYRLILTDKNGLSSVRDFDDINRASFELDRAIDSVADQDIDRLLKAAESLGEVPGNVELGVGAEKP